MAKFRASFTVLNAWAQGNTDEAIKMYFKLKRDVTPQMMAGARFHREWRDEVSKTQKLPLIFGGEKLKNPRCEVKRLITLEPWLDLVGVADLLDNQDLADYKTGRQTSEDYLRSFQHKVYQVLFAAYSPIRFTYYHYDQYENETDVSIVHLTRQTKREGLEWIMTFASEMHTYLTQEGLYERLETIASLKETTD